MVGRQGQYWPKRLDSPPPEHISCRTPSNRRGCPASPLEETCWCRTRPRSSPPSWARWSSPAPSASSPTVSACRRSSATSLAGIAIGPFTPGFVADTGLAQQLAEIGVILLMFGVGLHFSVRDLLDVRRVAVPGALAQMAVAVAAGVGLGLAWGWPCSRARCSAWRCRSRARWSCCASSRTAGRSTTPTAGSRSAGSSSRTSPWSSRSCSCRRSPGRPR